MATAEGLIERLLPVEEYCYSAAYCANYGHIGTEITFSCGMDQIIYCGQRLKITRRPHLLQSCCYWAVDFERPDGPKELMEMHGNLCFAATDIELF